MNERVDTYTVEGTTVLNRTDPKLKSYYITESCHQINIPYHNTASCIIRLAFHADQKWTNSTSH